MTPKDRGSASDSADESPVSRYLIHTGTGGGRFLPHTSGLMKTVQYLISLPGTSHHGWASPTAADVASHAATDTRPKRCPAAPPSTPPPAQRPGTRPVQWPAPAPLASSLLGDLVRGNSHPERHDHSPAKAGSQAACPRQPRPTKNPNFEPRRFAVVRDHGVLTPPCEAVDIQSAINRVRYQKNLKIPSFVGAGDLRRNEKGSLPGITPTSITRMILTERDICGYWVGAYTRPRHRPPPMGQGTCDLQVFLKYVNSPVIPLKL